MDKKDALAELKLDRDAKPAMSPGHRGWWIGGLCLVAILVALGVSWWVFSPQAVAVQTMTITAQGGPAAPSGGGILNSSGYVVARLETTVSSQITGKIVSVSVEEGMHVKKGQVLARLDDRAFKAAKASAQSELQTDRASVIQARARLKLDNQTLDRDKSLYKDHMVSQAALDTARAAVKIDTAALEHAEGQVETSQANLHLARVRLSYTVIRAPFAGMVTEKYAHPGEMISPAAVGGFTQTGICKLVDMKSLELDVDVNESYIRRVHAGQKVEAVLDAYPDWRMPAHVIHVVPTANRQKGTVKVRIAFDKLDPRILPQMSAQAWFYSKKDTHRGTQPQTQIGRIEIPEAAVHGSNGNHYVYLMKRGQAKKQTVGIGPTVTGGKLTVRTGLNAGETLIVASVKPLHDGQAVRRKPQ